MIYKILRGDRILFVGPEEEITPLFNSAYNWGAIDIVLKKDQTDDSFLLNIGEFKGFSVKTNKITRWRVNTLLTKFDCDRLISRRLIRKLILQAKKWLETFEIIPGWHLRHEFSTYQYTITQSPKHFIEYE